MVSIDGKTSDYFYRLQLGKAASDAVVLPLSFHSVLLSLLSRGWMSWASRETLARESHCGRRSVKYAIADFVDRGWARTYPHPTPELRSWVVEFDAAALAEAAGEAAPRPPRPPRQGPRRAGPSPGQMRMLRNIAGGMPFDEFAVRLADGGQKLDGTSYESMSQADVSNAKRNSALFRLPASSPNVDEAAWRPWTSPVGNGAPEDEGDEK